jgi:hypothetical protein
VVVMVVGGFVWRTLDAVVELNAVVDKLDVVVVLLASRCARERKHTIFIYTQVM